MYCISIDFNDVNQLSDYTLTPGIDLDFSQDLQKAFIRIGSQRVYLCKELFGSYVKPYLGSLSKYSGLYGLVNHSTNMLKNEELPFEFKNYSLLREMNLKTYYSNIEIARSGCPYIKAEDKTKPNLVIKCEVPYSIGKKCYIIPKGNTSIIKHHKVKSVNPEYTNLYDIVSLQYLFNLNALDPLFIVVFDKENNNNQGYKVELLWDASFLSIKVSKVNLHNYSIIKSLHIKRIKIEDDLKKANDVVSKALKSISQLHAKYIFE